MKYTSIRKRIGTVVIAGVTALSMAVSVYAGEAESSSVGVSEMAEEVSVSTSETAEGSSSSVSEAAEEAEDTAVSGEAFEDSSDGGHAIEADGETVSYTGISVKKTGEAEGDEADFYGENAAVFATNGASLEITDSTVTTDGTHANGIFSYGEGTTVHVSDTTIETSGNCSGGLMTTGGGTMQAENLTIHTTGNSSAAIRSDRGGGTVQVTEGSYTTDGVGSPVIYSTADITVSDAEMTSTSAQGVVVEGKNSVTLNNVSLTADNTSKNSDKSDYYQAVMIYQSMSGDAAEGEASFAMNGGTLTNLNGDIFFVNNTVASIDLNGAEIVNEDEEGVFLRAAAAGWGNEGANGGHVTMTAADQEITGDLLVDEVSSLNLYLTGTSVLEGAVNPDGTAGEIYVEVGENASWTLTGDSYITSLTCDADAVDLNGYTLYVDGEAYEEGTASEGEAVVVEISAGKEKGDRPDAPPEGKTGRPMGKGGQKDGKNGSGSDSGRQQKNGEQPDGTGERPAAPPEGDPGEMPSAEQTS